MLEINSKPFGKIKILPEQVIEFPEGLLGFENYHEFALIEENEDSPFKWLQSLEEQSLAFIVIQPEIFMDEYKPLIPDDELAELGIDSVDNSLKLVIVTIPRENPQEMTANLQGPIIINKKKRSGKQLISRDDRHPVRHRMMEGNS